MPKEIPSPIKSIRLKCLDCMCDQRNEVKLCPMDGKQSTLCALHPYRMGKRPDGGRKRVMTEEQRTEVAERFKKAREDKRNN